MPSWLTLPGCKENRINRLALWLESTIETDAAVGTTLRAARVISRARGGLPAPGFFMKCSTLGLYDGPADGPQAYAFHLKPAVRPGCPAGYQRALRYVG